MVIRNFRQASFKICGWRTNGAKNDMTYVELIALYEKIIAQARSAGLIVACTANRSDPPKHTRPRQRARSTAA